MMDGGRLDLDGREPDIRLVLDASPNSLPLQECADSRPTDAILRIGDGISQFFLGGGEGWSPGNEGRQAVFAGR